MLPDPLAGRRPKSRSISPAGVDFRLFDVLPAVMRHQFICRSTKFCGDRRTQFSDAVSVLLDPSRPSGIAKPVPETVLGQRSTPPQNEVPRPGLGLCDDAHDPLVQLDRDPGAGFLGLDRQDVPIQMLRPQPVDVAAPQAGQQQQLKCQPLCRADLPLLAKRCRVIRGPGWKARALITDRLDPDRWVLVHVPIPDGPIEQTAHGFQKRVGLGRRA